jgi:threonylcarbamoyladenosine tRNA methylthiotransferase MtaB
MKRVAITTLGCKTNQFESAAMTEALVREGFALVPFEAEAEIYIINTCTVTAKTDAESRRLIRRAVRKNGSAQVVVTGCYAQLAAEQLQDIAGVSLIIGNNEKKDIVALLREAGDRLRVQVSPVMAHDQATTLAPESFAEHTRAFLQIQNGCDAFCSYCIVPYARGRSRSVPFPEVVDGIRKFAAQGFREVVLTGIHLGAYGLDLNPRAELLDVLRSVEEGNLVERLRVGSVEPLEISPALVAFLGNSRTVCPHLHIPLQSGCDTVLERMNRRYPTAFFRRLVASLVEVVPDLSLGLDLIAGFPGETEAEFLAGYQFVAQLPVAYFHVFPYSVRPGTAAATLPGHLPPAVIKERAEQLRLLGESKREAYYRSFIGRTVPVLIQTSLGDGTVKGLSRNYLSVRLPANDTLLNREVAVRIGHTDGAEAWGELIAD